MNIVLVEPQIPPNTGNIARLCAATGIALHLVGKIGFQLTDRYLRRAGLDYWEHVTLQRHETTVGFFETIPASKLHFFSKSSILRYSEGSYRPGDYLVFGSETSGLPAWLRGAYPTQFRSIPMLSNTVRSLNLSSAVAIVVYEALRQQEFRSLRC